MTAAVAEPQAKETPQLTLLELDGHEPVLQYIYLDRLVLPPGMVYPPPGPDMIESAKAGGILVPIALRDRGDNTFDVVDGIRRVACAKLLAPKFSVLEREAKHLDPIWATVYPPTCTVSEALVLVLNNERSENIVREVAAVQNMLLAGATKEQIAKAVHLDGRTLKRRLNILGMEKPLLEAFFAGKFPPRLAEKVGKWSLPRQSQVIHVLDAKGKVTGEDVDAVQKVAQKATIAALPMGDLLGDTMTPGSLKAGLDSFLTLDSKGTGYQVNASGSLGSNPAAFDGGEDSGGAANEEWELFPLGTRDKIIHIVAQLGGKKSSLNGEVLKGLKATLEGVLG